MLLGNSVYAFSALLGAYLIGIAAGSAEQMLVDNYTDDMVIELPYASPPEPSPASGWPNATASLSVAG